MFDDVTKERFWSKADKSGGPDACWPWKGVTRGKGYGIFKALDRTFAAHRVSLYLDTGREDLFLTKGVVYMVPSICRHMCHNPRCVNPAHLKWGTPEDNSRDRPKERLAEAARKANATKAVTGNWGGVPAMKMPVETKMQHMARMEAALRSIVAINPAELQKDDSMALFHAFLLARETAVNALAKPTNT